MKYFIMFMLLLPVLIYSQENNYDLLNLKQTLSTQFNLMSDFNFYFSLSNIQNSSNDMPVIINPKTIGLWTSFAVSKSYMGEAMPVTTKSFMLTPLNIKYGEDTKFNSVRYILGMAQTAAVGYMAYIHLKKYGFLK
ncbi:MAG: hypothetical protein WCE54_17540 [Ignavibacteriaceae bacterium]